MRERQAAAQPPRSRTSRLRDDQRGEALPVAILFLGVFLTIMIGIHVVIVAVGRTAVQSAADRALTAAQAGSLDYPRKHTHCDDDASTEHIGAECEGIIAARAAMIGARGSVIQTRMPAVVVEPDKGTVTVLVFGGVISPVLGGIEFTGRACGPLDNVPVSSLSSPEAWQC